MKRNEFKYPLVLAALIAAGVGKRKAHRMVKHAVFINRKTKCSTYDTSWLSGFCIWADQGKYRDSWMEACNNAGR